MSVTNSHFPRVLASINLSLLKPIHTNTGAVFGLRAGLSCSELLVGCQTKWGSQLADCRVLFCVSKREGAVLYQAY